MLDFTAIDFETANSYRGSPCAVGLIRFRNGQPVDERRWLIRPPEPVDFFSPFNVALHGIDAETVKDAPRWNLVLPAIVDYIDDDIVVAHNAGFDIGVIRYACAVDNIEWPEMQFLCSLVLARRALRLPSYRLPFVTEGCGFEMTNHHDPLADARAVGGVIAALARQAGVDDLHALAAEHRMHVGRMSSGIYKGSVAISGNSALVRPDLNPDADPDGYLYGRVVVFTGALMSMTRQIAWEECARVGALAEKNTTKRTNVLVVGDINPAVLRPGSHITGKARRAFELQDKGQDIEVMTEDDFVRCLDGKSLTDVTDLFLDPAPGPQANLPGMRDRLRSVPLDQRPEPTPPQPPKPPRPLRRTPVPTDQVCSVDGCAHGAAFKTRSKPTFCTAHIDVILTRGGLEALESFTHPEDYLLTRCLRCRNVAHYRFAYVQGKDAEGEPTCRACYWRNWGAHQRESLGQSGDNEPVPYEKAEATAEEHGYIYLGPLTNPSMADDPHRVECRRCGKITAERLGDIAFGCTCHRCR